ncbi:LPS assembly protein LptD [Escherichia sp. R-CC3]
MEMLAPGYTQTLEPRAQYLYVPYRDQSDIYNYDSSLQQSVPVSHGPVRQS